MSRRHVERTDKSSSEDSEPRCARARWDGVWKWARSTTRLRVLSSSTETMALVWRAVILCHFVPSASFSSVRNSVCPSAFRLFR